MQPLLQTVIGQLVYRSNQGETMKIKLIILLVCCLFSLVSPAEEYIVCKEIENGGLKCEDGYYKIISEQASKLQTSQIQKSLIINDAVKETTDIQGESHLSKSQGQDYVKEANGDFAGGNPPGSGSAPSCTGRWCGGNGH